MKRLARFQPPWHGTAPSRCSPSIPSGPGYIYRADERGDKCILRTIGDVVQTDATDPLSELAAGTGALHAGRRG